MNTYNENRDSGVRQKQKEKTAAKILEAAKNIFEKEGYEKANIRKIAKEANVAPGSVINHYKDKTSLLHFALYDDLEKVLKKCIKKFGRDSLEKDLASLTHSVFKYYQKRANLSKVLLKESLFAESPWAERFAEQTAYVHKSIVDICEAQKEKGNLRKEVDSNIFAASYLSFFYFNLIAWAQGAYPSPVNLVNRMTREYLKLLK